jgi:hypothetical protein
MNENISKYTTKTDTGDELLVVRMNIFKEIDKTLFKFNRYKEDREF